MSPKQYGKPQQKTIVLLGERVGYTLTRKSVKNLNLRINREGQVSLSIPRRVSQAQAEEFLQAKAEFILGALEKVKARQHLHELTVSQESGSRVSVWGIPLTLYRLEGEPEVYQEEDLLLVRTRTPEGVDSAWREFCKQECRKKAEEFLPKVMKDFEDVILFPPELRYRRMTSRWGSCNVKTRQITLNTRLAEYQETALLAVLYHEVTHLLCPDHSQKFYRELLRRCPRYREWTEVLK